MNDNHSGNTNNDGNGSGNTNNSNNNNGSTGNNNGSGNDNGSTGNSNNNNNGGTTDPTTPTNPTENEVAYKINFVDYSNNDKVFKTIELKGKVGEKVDYTADVSIDVDGVHYVLGGSSELQHSITLDKDANKNVINVKYQPQVLPDTTSYIVNYVDEAGKPVAKSKKIDNVKMMSDITEYAPVVDGYTVKNSNVISTILTEENQVLTFVYAKTTAPTTKTDVNIHFVDEDGKEIASTKKSEGNIGDIFTASAVTVDGYKLNGDSTQSIKLSKSGNNITFHYTKAVAPVEKTSYTVSYQTADGTKLQADKVVNDQEVGKQVTETAHSIKGYKLTSQATQTMTLAKSGNHITFTYAKEEAPVAKTTYTVSYQAEDGTKLQADKTVKDQAVGASVSETAPAIAGYTVKGNATQTMTLAKDNNHIIFTYSKDSAPVQNIDPQVVTNLFNELVNKERASKGLAPLKENVALNKVATIRAKQIENDFNHIDDYQLLIDNGYASGDAGENIQKNFIAIDDTNEELAQRIFDNFKASAGHYATMMDSNGVDSGFALNITDTNRVFISEYVGVGAGNTAVDPQAIANKLTQLVNEERQRVGVAPMKVDEKLIQVAKTRAQQLSENFEHNPSVTNQLAKDAGYTTGVVENAVYDTLGMNETADEMAQDLFEGLRDDAPHYAAMIDADSVDLGTGIYVASNNQVYASQIMGTKADTSKPDATAIANKLTQLVNAERQRMGVAPLTANNSLVQVANVRAKQASENFEHNQDEVASLATQFGYKGSTAEILAYDILGMDETSDEMAQDLFDDWKEDAGHYANMLDDSMADEGMGIYITESNQVYASQIYGAKETAPVETATATANYVDESGRAIASQDTKSGNVGDAFSFTAKTIAGYKLVSQATQNGTFTKGGSSVTFTYKADAPVTGDHSTPVNAPAGTAGLLDGNTTPAGNTHNLWFYIDKQQAPAGQTKSNLIFSSMQSATDFAENYLDSTMLEPNALFNGYAVNQVFGDGLTPVAYTIYWR
ncbi:MucBP domain-containing protein [Latilactobacillus curvatus]|uniref:MucBP domain-containing protein n=1 Tax=Latilactobacillus curvatus TaxID=28038 RepID=UPI000FECE288|nr:MucBP domain-containing protein [Latilactobacillus curvatus]QAR35203.1 hypothetical protein EQK21_03715 [Latilactobacillus curvatus]